MSARDFVIVNNSNYENFLLHSDISTTVWIKYRAHIFCKYIRSTNIEIFIFSKSLDPIFDLRNKNRNTFSETHKTNKHDIKSGMTLSERDEISTSCTRIIKNIFETINYILERYNSRLKVHIK